MTKAVAFCIRARVPAKNPPAPAGGEARRSTKGECWWDATRPPPQPASVPRYAGLLRAIAQASPLPWRLAPALLWAGAIPAPSSLEPPPYLRPTLRILLPRRRGFLLGSDALRMSTSLVFELALLP